MWTITKSGFYSTVQHETDPTRVVVRCRRRADMEVFARFAGAEFITFSRDRDYPYRVLATHETWAGFLFREALSVNYVNFKDSIAPTDPARASVYLEVWQDLMALERGQPWPNGEKGYQRRYPLTVSGDQPFTFMQIPVSSEGSSSSSSPTRPASRRRSGSRRSSDTR